LLSQKINALDIPQDVNELINELQVHQIELEMQNEELRKSQLKLQTSQNRYFELYNFAPTSYFTLDEKELIKDVNIAGTNLLGLEKSNLINSAFIRFVAHDSRNKFSKLFHSTMDNNGHQKCELELLKDGKPIFVILEINFCQHKNGGFKSLLVTATDINDLKRAEKALKKSQSERSKIFNILNIAQEIAKVGSWEWDLETDEVWWSNETYHIFGVTNDYVPSFEANKDFIHPDDLSIYQEKFEDSLKTGELLDLDVRIVTKTGDIKYCHAPGKVINDKFGKPIRFIGNIMDITERKKADMKVKKSLEEKEVLLREVHHRVKNNLQIIASLLRLQEFTVDEEEVVDVLKESEGRVKSMAMVHENLYQSPTFSDINIKRYIEKLVSDILNTHGIPIESIKTDLIIEDVHLNIDTAIPLGLIVNELVTNSVKYAFPEKEGTITIRLKSLPEKFELKIVDDGIGLPKNLDIEKTETLGLKLVNSLVNQIDGVMELDRTHGTEFKISFKGMNYKDRFNYN
jgi:PAS domain S-box-containing protein